MKFEEIRAQLPFEELPYRDLSDDLVVSELSAGAWYIEDLFGEEPETYMRAEGDELPGNVSLNRPDDYELWVIDGDLEVAGALCLSVLDMTNVVVVNGNLRAEGVVLDSDVQLYVTGETELDGPLICRFAAAGYAHFAGPVSASGWFDVGSGETVFEADAPEQGDILEDEYHDYEDLLERLESGLGLT